jgi:predicted acetyltransferase
VGVAELVSPTPLVRDSFLRAVDELVGEGRAARGSILSRWIDGFGANWRSSEGFEAFLTHLALDALPETRRPDGLVRQSTWWLVDGDDYLGRICVRPHLGNEFLRTLGGHIGYEVRPTRRGEGHATTMLREVLPYAAELGVDPALVTCDVDNLASRAVIERTLERSGGSFLDETSGKRRYHLDTGAER